MVLIQNFLKIPRKLLTLYIFIIILSPIFFLLTKLFHNILSYTKLEPLLAISLLLSCICLTILYIKKKFLGNIVTQLQISQEDIFALGLIVLLSISSYMISIDVFSAQSFYQYGDNIRHIEVINDINIYPQYLLSHVYSDGFNVINGLFYPLQAHYLPAILVELFPISNSDAYTYSIIYYIHFLYPTFLYLLLRELSNSVISFYLTTLSSLASIFPLKFIMMGYFPMAYGNIILLLLFLVQIKIIKRGHNFFSLIAFIISSLMIFLAHPSSLFIYVIFICVHQIKLIKKIVISIKDKNLIFPCLVSLGVITYGISRSENYNALLSTLPERNPKFHYSLESIANRSIDIFVEFIFYMGDHQYMFPFFLLNLLLIVFIFLKRRKFIKDFEFPFLLLLISHLFYILSLFAGLDGLLKSLSYSGVFFYNSPVRLSSALVVSQLICASICIKYLHDLYTETFLSRTMRNKITMILSVAFLIFLSNQNMIYIYSIKNSY